MSYNLFNIGIDDDNEIIKFRTNKFQIDSFISYSLINYIDNIIPHNKDNELNLENNKIEYIQFGNVEADYIVYNDRVLTIIDYIECTIIDYIECITKYIFKINGVIINFDTKDLINAEYGKDISDDFNKFINDNYITYNAKLSKLKVCDKDNYKDYIRIDYNENYMLYAFEIKKIYNLYGKDFLMSLIEYCKENNNKSNGN